MQIVVVSDTHRDTRFIEKLVIAYPNCKTFLHAGDSELHELEIEPFLTVKGNCDYYIKNKYRVLELLGVRILMFHGDHTLLDENVLVGIAKNNNCDIIIHGHTHVPYYKYQEGIHLLCPGSITYPRVKDATYALITFSSKEDILVEIKNYE